MTERSTTGEVSDAMVERALAFVRSNSLYAFLTDIQNGIDSPATCGMALQFVLQLDRINAALEGGCCSGVVPSSASDRLYAALAATPAPPPAMQAEIDRLRADAEEWKGLYRFQTAMRFMDNSPSLDLAKATAMAAGETDRIQAGFDAARARDAGEVDHG